MICFGPKLFRQATRLCEREDDKLLGVAAGLNPSWLSLLGPCIFLLRDTRITPH